MDEKPVPDRPMDPRRPDGATSSDPVSEWAADALKDVHKAANRDSEILERKRTYLEQIEGDIAGRSPSDAHRIVESYLEGETDPEMRRALEHMMDALEHQEREAREAEARWRSRFSTKWVLAAGVAGVVLAAIILVSILAGTGELSCAPDEPASGSSGTTATAPPAEQPDTDSGPAEKPDTESGSQSMGSADPYLEARAALGLSLTTPDSVEHMNEGAGPMLFELSWVDGAEAPRVKLGSIGVITLTEDRTMQEGGRATLAGSDSVGAYVIGKEAGQVNIGVRIAIRVAGPDGGEPQSIIFTLKNTEGSSLVGTAKPDGGGDPDPPRYVLGERLQHK